MFLSVFFFSQLVMGNELTDCRTFLNLKTQEMERGGLDKFLLLIPEVSDWVMASKSYSEAFLLSEPYGNAPFGSAQSFLFANALQSCLDFKSSFEKQLDRYHLYFWGGLSLMILVALGTVSWRFKLLANSRKAKFVN